jgi:hypothetical protein
MATEIVEAELLCGWCEQVVPGNEGQVMEDGIVVHDNCAILYALRS